MIMTKMGLRKLVKAAIPEASNTQLETIVNAFLDVTTLQEGADEIEMTYPTDVIGLLRLVGAIQCRSVIFTRLGNLAWAQPKMLTSADVRDIVSGDLLIPVAFSD